MVVVSKTKNNMAEFTYRLQLAGPTRIVLPQRYGLASALLFVLCAAALSFVYSQTQVAEPKPQPSSTTAPVTVSPISQAEAAPVLKPEPTVDPRLDEAAALMPTATLEQLPTKTVTETKPHAIVVSIQTVPQTGLKPKADRLLQLTTAGITAGRNGNYVAADAALRSALVLDRGNPVILYNLALVAEHRGDPDSARTLYESAMKHAIQRPDTPLQPDQVLARLNALDAVPPTDQVQSLYNKAQP